MCNHRGFGLRYNFSNNIINDLKLSYTQLLLVGGYRSVPWTNKGTGRSAVTYKAFTFFLKLYTLGGDQNED